MEKSLSPRSCRYSRTHFTIQINSPLSHQEHTWAEASTENESRQIKNKQFKKGIKNPSSLAVNLKWESKISTWLSSQAVTWALLVASTWSSAKEKITSIKHIESNYPHTLTIWNNLRIYQCHQLLLWIRYYQRITNNSLSNLLTLKMLKK